MAVTLSETQERWLRAPAVRMVPLVELTTYSDKGAGTVATSYSFSTLPIEYLATFWDPFVASISPIYRSFSHIPNPDFLDLRDGMRIELIDSDFDDGPLFGRLLYDESVHGATIAVYSLILDPEYQPTYEATGTTAFDATSLGGPDRVCRFRGEVARIGDYQQESGTFTLICNATEPVIDWPRARDAARVDPRDLGKRYPVPVNEPDLVRCIGREVGGITPLLAEIDDSTEQQNIAISDESVFPASGTLFDAIVGSEVIRFNVDASGNNFLDIAGSGRGRLSSTVSAHGIGTSVIEIPEAVRFVYSGFLSKGVRELWLLQPSGERLRIPSTYYTDVPGWGPETDDGKLLGCVVFTEADFADMLQTIGQGVALQPGVAVEAGSDPDIVEIPPGGFEQISGISGAVSSDAPIGLGDSGLFMDYTSTTSSDDGIRMSWPTASVPDQSRTVQRFRVVVKFRIEGNGTSATRLYGEYSSILNESRSKTLMGTRTATGEEYDTYAFPWDTPIPDATLADLVGGTVTCYLDQASGSGSTTSAFVNAVASYVEVELDPLVPTASVDQGAEVAGGTRVGQGVTILADCSGVKDEGLTIPLAPDFTTTTGWTSIGSTTLSIQGGDRLRVQPPGAAGVGGAYWALSSPGNYSTAGYSIVADVYVDDVSRLDATRGIALRLYSSSVNYTDYWYPAVAAVEDEFVRLAFDLTNHADQVDTGSGVTLSNVTRIGFVADDDLGLVNWTFEIREFSLLTSSDVETIDEVAGFIRNTLAPSSALDTSSFSTANTNLSSAEPHLDLREAGETLSEVFARIGYELRTNIVPIEGTLFTQYRALNSDESTTPHWSASPRAISEWRDLRIETRDLDEVPTRFEALYEKAGYLDPGVAEAYRSIGRIENGNNDFSSLVANSRLTYAEGLRGVVRGEPLTFYAHKTSAAVGPIFAYYVNEALDTVMTRVSLRATLEDAYDLELGDLVEIESFWGASPPFRRYRLVGIAFEWDSPTIGLQLVEVDYNDLLS